MAVNFADFVRQRRGPGRPAGVDEIGELPAEARFALFPLYRADGAVMTRDLLELMLAYLEADPPDVAKNQELAAHIRALLT